MKRRAFLSAFGLLSVPAAIAAAPASADQPFTHASMRCPSCALWMMVVTHAHEKTHGSDADVWSCGRCRRSWLIPQQRMASTEVPYDDGARPRG